MSRWKAFGIALAVIALVGCTSGSDAKAKEPSASQLPEGFEVARGSRLVGAVFPQFDASTATASTASAPRRWVALVAARTNAPTAYRRYASMARRAGLVFPPVGSNCDDPEARLTRTGTRRNLTDPMSCLGSGISDDGTRTLSIESTICTAECGSTSYLVLTYEDSTSERLRVERRGDAPTTSSDPRGDRVSAALAGSRVLAQVSDPDCGEGGTLVVREHRGSADALVTQLAGASNPATVRASFQGRQVRQLSVSGSTFNRTVTVVSGGTLPHPISLEQTCA